MAKYVVTVMEMLTREVVCEADSYEEAGEKVEQAYSNEVVQLHADNSNVTMEVTCITGAPEDAEVEVK